MAPGTRTIKASCLCGNAAHEITLPSQCFPLPTTMCHCNSCRHMTGAMAFACTRMPPEYQPDPALFDKIEAFHFSDKIEQYFCGTCGAHVIERSTSPASSNSEAKVSFGVMTGTLQELEGVIELRGHIYVGDTHDGGIADLLPRWKGKDLPRWVERDNNDNTVPLYPRNDTAKHIAAHPSESLHAHCKCGGVEFWIFRAKKGTADSSIPTKRPEPSETGEMCTPELARYVRAESGKYLACNCVCNSCRSGAGHEITSWATVPPSDIRLDAEGKTPFTPIFGTLKSYQSSPGHTRSFCSVCGSRAFYQAGKGEDSIDVGVGLIDAAEGARADSWIEWQLHRVGFREDAQGRADSLLHALEDGAREFLKQEKSKP